MPDNKPSPPPPRPEVRAKVQRQGSRINKSSLEPIGPDAPPKDRRDTPTREIR